MTTKAIIGLGNPGSRYEITRHNAGFLAVDNLVEAFNGSWRSSKYKGQQADIRVGSTKILVGKPETYMNLSGFFVTGLVGYFRIAPADTLIVYDDMDLPLGRLRFSRGGGAGGHKGIASVMQQLGTNDVPRLKIGVGKSPEGVDPAGYVLSPFTQNELDIISKLMEYAVKAQECWAHAGITESMNSYNQDFLSSTKPEGVDAE
jgi:peptidyl-tRNA hydrolase, PTH1 family